MPTHTEPATTVSRWSSDQAHTMIHFKVRHMMISWVRGEFRSVKGTLEWDEQDVTCSRVSIDIDTSSIATHDSQRDEHCAAPTSWMLSTIPPYTSNR